MLPAPIIELATAGVKLIAAYESGATIAKGDEYQAAFTCDLDELASLWAGNGDRAGRARGIPLRRYRYEAAAAGFIVLDLDRKNGKDGVKDLHDALTLARFIIPRQLAYLDDDSHPCTVYTPSGGFHLYYKYTGSPQNHAALTASGAVELFHTGNLITAPGSEKDGKPYRMAGSFYDAPTWPPILAAILARKLEAEARLKQEKAAKRAAYQAKQQGRNTTKPNLEQIAQWTIDDGEGTSKNPLCAGIALRAARYGYTAGEIETFLTTYPDTAGHKQIVDAIKSAFQKQGRG